MFATIPGLGITNLPINFGSGLGGGWCGCANVSVLGYPLCAAFSNPCTPSMVSAGFLVCLQCLGGGNWTLSAVYTAYGNNVCDLPPTTTKQSRAIDFACGANPTSCLSGIPGSLSGGAAWTAPLSCTRPTTIAFAGPPAMDPRTPVNLYFGTSASVSE